MLFMRDFTPHRHMGLQAALPEAGAPARQVLVTMIGPTLPTLAGNARLHAETEAELHGLARGSERLVAEGETMVRTVVHDNAHHAREFEVNTGQCIPVNAIAQGFAETVKKHDLDPANTLLWISKANMRQRLQ